MAAYSLPLTFRPNRQAVVALWLAFLAGLVGADLWFSQGGTVSLPEAVIAVGPTPLPLVEGVNPSDIALPAAPDAALEENAAEGRLPVIGADGRMPLAVYGYPFDRDDPRPRVSIVLTGVGLETAALAKSIERLPGAVGLAFSVFTPDLAGALSRARTAGHETLLAVAADGRDPLAFDPGPGAIRSALSADENMQRLRLMMGQSTGYVGLVIDPQTTVLDNANMAGALLSESQKRGLAIVAMNPEFARMGAAQGSPIVNAVAVIDPLAPPEAIDTVLVELEQRARESGMALVLAPSYPVVVDRLAHWLPGLSGRGVALAPASALVPLPAPQAAPEQGSTH